MFEDQPKSTLPPANLPGEPEDIFAATDDALPPGAPAAPSINQPNALSAGLLKPKAATAVSEAAGPSAQGSMGQAAEAPVVFEAKEPKVGKIIMIIFFIALTAGLIWGGVWAYGRFIKPSAPAAAVVPAAVIPPTTTPSPAPAPAPTLPPSFATATIEKQTANETILFGEQIDSDQDGLTDAFERQSGTNPNNQDSDGDDLTDGAEALYWHTGPLVKDTDGDGVNDGDEINRWRTDPLNPDTDGDGYPDGQEVSNGFNPLGPGRPPKDTAPTSTPA